METLPFEPLSQTQIEAMKTERLAPDADTIENNVQEIRQWILGKKDISTQFDTKLVYSYLFGCNFNVEMTKTKIQNHVDLKLKHCKFFDNRDPLSDRLQISSKIVNSCILPKPTSDGYRVIYTGLANPNSKDYDVVDAFKKLFAMMDILLLEDHCCNGYIYIVSGKSFGFWHATNWNISLCLALFEILVKMKAERFVEWHFVDVNNLLKPLFHVAMKVLDDSVRKKIHFNDKKVLEASLPKEILPKEYGGNAEYDMEQLNKSWQVYYERHRKHFLQLS